MNSEIIGRLEKYRTCRIGSLMSVSHAYQTKSEMSGNQYPGKYSTDTTAKDLPDTIDEVDANGESPDFSGNILEKAIVCEESGRLFRIIKMELEFYRKM